jgi:hypothetical protein
MLRKAAGVERRASTPATPVAPSATTDASQEERPKKKKARKAAATPGKEARPGSNAQTLANGDAAARSPSAGGETAPSREPDAALAGEEVRVPRLLAGLLGSGCAEEGANAAVADRCLPCASPRTLPHGLLEPGSPPSMRGQPMAHRQRREREGVRRQNGWPQRQMALLGRTAAQAQNRGCATRRRPMTREARSRRRYQRRRMSGLNSRGICTWCTASKCRRRMCGRPRARGPGCGAQSVFCQVFAVC